MIGIETTILSTLTLIAQGLVVFLLGAKLLKKERILTFFSKHVLLFIFIVALTATTGSLYYSNVVGFTPCMLCIWQRILMFPQVVLLGLALAREDLNIRIYSFTLSILGTALALYHYYTQAANDFIIPCSAAGECTRRFFTAYGYITIPMMAASAFALIATLIYISFKNRPLRLQSPANTN